MEPLRHRRAALPYRQVHRRPGGEHGDRVAHQRQHRERRAQRLQQRGEEGVVLDDQQEVRVERLAHRDLPRSADRGAQAVRSGGVGDAAIGQPPVHLHRRRPPVREHPRAGGVREPPDEVARRGRAGRRAERTRRDRLVQRDGPRQPPGQPTAQRGTRPRHAAQEPGPHCRGRRVQSITTAFDAALQGPHRPSSFSAQARMV